MAASGTAFAHSTMHENHIDEAEHTPHSHHISYTSVAGKPGSEYNVNRTVAVAASDKMRFDIIPLTVRANETIAFKVTNKGKMTHEFAIGVADEHKQYRDTLKKMPDMQQERPNAVIIDPGETKTLIWTFAKAYDIQVACNFPGHYEAGIHSPIRVR